MSLEGLQERLAALQETTTQLRELIDRLANVEFEPGSVPLNIEEEGSVSGELSAEAGLILKTGLEDQQLLFEEAKYLRRGGHEKERLVDGIERVGSELASYRATLRKARLSAKKNLERARRLERELMVQSFVEPISETNTSAGGSTEEHRQLQSSLSEEDRQTVGAASNVTNALRRTHALIAAELSKSEFAHQTLTESSAALKQLDQSYTSLDGMLASSRDLLGTLLRSQKSDTWYLQTALYMLMVTAGWLVFRRLLYGPLWWLVWLPLRILFGVGTKAGSAVMHSRSPGQSGKAGVVIDGKIRVDGLPDESLPTAVVGRDSKVVESEDESMVEKVGKIVDAVHEADELGSIPGESEGDHDDKLQEGDAAEVVVEDSRPRDEL
ncbi:sec20 domain-containing protein [Trichoderma breve]|uniref:Sec20 domain-containing protein n=1 Tax=Trichoderma breve TaxID=2034170 RepID=A0A9W9E4I8_9HYPO|nr:sec20 domain-containing protein [Trichoderma breve]KAJ4858798.1 sec20 domain-containing protein [Trichoderma breve]